MERPRSFRGWVDIGVELLGRKASAQGQDLTNVRETLVTEEENGRRSDEWIPDLEFERRFEHILTRTTRSWVNVHFDSLDGGVPRLVVGYISRHDESAVSVPVDKISVNFSGPEGGWTHIAKRQQSN
jgi:hypothetical protein